jgi:hypothetical protein
MMPPWRKMDEVTGETPLRRSIGGVCRSVKRVIQLCAESRFYNGHTGFVT